MNHHQTPLIAALLQSAKSNGRPSLLGYASDPSKSWVTPGRCTAAKNHGCNSQNPNGMIHHNPSWIEPVQRWAWQLGRQNWGRTPPGRVQGVLVQIEPLVVGQSSFRMLPWQPAGLVRSLQGLSDCSYLQLPNNAEKITGFLWTKQSCNTINNSQRAHQSDHIEPLAGPNSQISQVHDWLHSTTHTMAYLHTYSAQPNSACGTLTIGGCCLSSPHGIKLLQRRTRLRPRPDPWGRIQIYSDCCHISTEVGQS